MSRERPKIEGGQEGFTGRHLVDYLSSMDGDDKIALEQLIDHLSGGIDELEVIDDSDIGRRIVAMVEDWKTTWNEDREKTANQKALQGELSRLIRQAEKRNKGK